MKSRSIILTAFALVLLTLTVLSHSSIDKTQNTNQPTNYSQTARGKLDSLLDGLLSDVSIKNEQTINLVMSGVFTLATPPTITSVTPSPLLAPTVAGQAFTGTFTINGTNFQGGDITTDGPLLLVGNAVVNPTGTVITRNYQISCCAANGTVFHLFVGTPSGQAQVSNTIAFPAPTPTPTPTTISGVSVPIWQTLGPRNIPNAHSCDNVAEMSLLAAGKIQAFATDPSNPSVMYSGGGVGQGTQGPLTDAGVFKSTDGGTHWVSINNGMNDRTVDALWLDPLNPSTLLASTYHGGIFRSVDAGQTWTNMRGAGTTAIVQRGAIVLAAASDGIVSSNDSGATWSLSTPTSSAARTLACGGGACYAGLNDGSVLVQATASSQWVTALTGSSAMSPFSMAVNPANALEAIMTRMNAGTLENLITRNGGSSWSALPAPNAVQGGCAGGPSQVFAFDSVNPNIIYAGFGGAMWVSSNDAGSWTPLHLYEDLRYIYPLPGQSGKLVAGGDQGIYMSQDTGAAWRSLNGDLSTSLITGLAVSGTEVITAVQDYSVIKSFDGGGSWLQQVNTGEDGVVIINPQNPQYQYAFTTGGFAYSSDGGRNFTNDNASIAYTEFTHNGTTDLVAIDPANPQHLYLTGNSGVFESIDYGVHWHTTGWPIANPSFVVFDPNNSRKIFVGYRRSALQNNEGVSVTNDGGTTWSSASLPQNFQGPISLAVDPSDSNTVVLATTVAPGFFSGGGVFLSTDGGRTFSVDNQGLVTGFGDQYPYYAGSVRFAPQGFPHVVVVATSNGLYISKAGGPWMDISGNAVAHWFTAIAWTEDSLYAATFGEGVLKAPISAILTGTTYTISGQMLYGTTPAGQAAKLVPGVSLAVDNSSSAQAISDNTGSYSLANLASGQHTVTPSKTGDANHIDANDALRIQQYLVSTVNFTPNQIAAADTNGDGFIRTPDAARIQQYAVGGSSTGITGQWDFIPSSKNYALGSNLVNENYTAVLIGEVTGNWIAPTSAGSATTVSAFSTDGGDSSSDQQSKNDQAEEEPAEINQANEVKVIQPQQQIKDVPPQDTNSIGLQQDVLAPSTAQTGVSVTLPTNATASTGTTVTIPIDVSQLPALNAANAVQTYAFNLQYDPTVLTNPVLDSTGTLSAAAGGSLIAGSPQAGVLSVNYTNANGITGQGTLVNVKFTVLGTAGQTSNLTFVTTQRQPDPFIFNEGDPQATTANGLFTVTDATAATVSLTGRVITQDGRGVSGVQISLTDSDGNARTAVTTSFGYYRFDDVEAGGTYVLSAAGKHYTFSQAVQVLNITQDMNAVDFIANFEKRIRSF